MPGDGALFAGYALCAVEHIRRGRQHYWAVSGQHEEVHGGRASSERLSGVRKVLAAMRREGKLVKMGGVRLFTDDEEALIMVINTSQASVGAGMHRDLARAVFREAAHAKGTTMSRALIHADNTGTPVLDSERAKAAQLLAATVDLKTYTRIKGRVNKGGLLAGAQVREGLP